jgi:hypothetical protein
VIGEAKFGGQVGELLLAGGHAVDNDRRTDLVAVLLRVVPVVR